MHTKLYIRTYMYMYVHVCIYSNSLALNTHLTQGEAINSNNYIICNKNDVINNDIIIHINDIIIHTPSSAGESR